MLKARVLGMTFGLLVGLTDWLLRWPSNQVMSDMVLGYIMIMIMMIIINSARGTFEEFFSWHQRVHVAWFVGAATITALALAPLQLI